MVAGLAFCAEQIITAYGSDKKLQERTLKSCEKMTQSDARKAREKAIADGMMFYHGRPCYICHETLRHVSYSACVACDKERKRK